MAKQLSLLSNLILGNGKQNKSTTAPYIKRRAELWSELQAKAKKYEDTVYDRLLDMAQHIQPQLAWDKLSREDFFTTFLKWQKTKNLVFPSLPGYPVNYPGHPSQQPAVPRSQIQTSIQLDPTRARGVDTVYVRKGTFYQQLGYYAEQAAEDILRNNMTQVFQHKITKSAGVGGNVYSVGSQAVDTRVSVWWTGAKGFITSPVNINLDHKMNMNSFSVTQAEVKTIPVSSEYYSPISYANMGPALKQAIAVEILYDKYKNTQPFFYSSNNLDHILTPTQFFKRQKDFQLLSGDVLEVTQNYIENEINDRIQEELKILNEPYLTKEDLLREPIGKAIIAEVKENTKEKLVIANYSVYYK